MTPEQFNVVSKFTDEQLRVYFLGFAAGAGHTGLPSEEEQDAALVDAKSLISERLVREGKRIAIGTKFVINKLHPDISLGKVYTIEGYDEDGDEFFIDDVGDQNFLVCSPGPFGAGDGYRHYTVVG
jgi:hypothetical protein